MVLIGAMTVALVNGTATVSLTTTIVSYVLTVLLMAIFVMALPAIRHKYHDQFELMHRFGGWSSLILFYVQTVLFVNDGRGDVPLGAALFSSFGFVALLVVTVSIVLPWLG